MATTNTTSIPTTDSVAAPVTTTLLSDTATPPAESTPSVSITTTASAPTTAETTPSAAPTTTEPSTAPTPTATSEPPTTSTTTAPSEPPTTVIIQTSVITQTPTDPAGSTQAPQTTVIVITETPSDTPTPTTSSSTSGATTSNTAALQAPGSSDGGGGGLSTAGTTAVAVVVPVVVVALLVVAGIFFWRRRKQRKAAEEARRVEVEDYGFNPNNDPTLPVVASESGHEMAEDSSNGYRGWGAAGAASRKMSTTLSGGHTQGQLSDAGSNAYRGGNSPNGGNSDGHSGDPLMHARRETMNSDEIGALGAAPLAGANQNGVRRGPSNASSTYSAAGHTDVSDDGPGTGSGPQQYEAYNPNMGYGYSQHGPYGDGSYGGTGQEGGMPVVRDVSARRNTRIQQAGSYQQGNSGIAQNF